MDSASELCLPWDESVITVTRSHLLTDVRDAASAIEDTSVLNDSYVAVSCTRCISALGSDEPLAGNR